MERVDKTCLLMDEFSVHLMTSCCSVIKEYGSEVGYILGGYASRPQVMDVGVNNPLKAM